MKQKPIPPNQSHCFVAVFEGKLPTTFADPLWQPWLDADPRDPMLPKLAAHKYIRERGGVLPDERLRLFVCTRLSLSSQSIHYTELSVLAR